MKKYLLTLLFLFTIFILGAQSAERQFIVPHTVFVGDTAQLNITFTSKTDFFKDDQQQKNRGPQTKELSFDNFTYSLDPDLYSIKNIVLTKTGNTGSAGDGKTSYTFTILFTPWTTGKIKFPPYMIEKDFFITPSDINIDSIFSVNKTTKGFSEAKGPLLVPGTTYRILFKLIFLIILLIAAILIFCRWEKVSLWYKNQKLKWLYTRNKKQTIQALMQLERSMFPDREKAGQMQNILRKYLTVRFGYPFSNCGASEIWSGFYEIFQGLLSEKKEDAVEDLTGIFIRTDFIRYSKDASFDDKEINNLVSQITKIINTLESPDVQEQKEETR